MEINNTPAITEIARAMNIKKYIEGKHKIKARKDFSFKGEKFETAKIVIQSIKSIIDFHASYICGVPNSLIGDAEQLKALQAVYKKGMYNKVNFQIARDIYTYGNAYEYIYQDNGIIKSKVFRPQNCYAIYDNGGKYERFVEKIVDGANDIEYITEYTPTEVIEYEGSNEIGRYNNPTGLPIHYTSGDLDDSGYFGLSIVDDLIPIIDEIEALLSKMTDSVNTLSLNPLGVSSGDRVDTSVDADVTGAVLNIESGGEFKWATAQLDNNAINTILTNLLSQFYTIAQVPSVVYGQSNIANVSEVSLKLLFNCADNLAKKTTYELLEGFNKRLEVISTLLGIDVTNIAITFNYNRPVDNSAIVSDIKEQVDLGIMSKDTAMMVSPYVVDIDREKELLTQDVVNN